MCHFVNTCFCNRYFVIFGRYLGILWSIFSKTPLAALILHLFPTIKILQFFFEPTLIHSWICEIKRVEDNSVCGKLNLILKLSCEMHTITISRDHLFEMQNMYQLLSRKDICRFDILRLLIYLRKHKRKVWQLFCWTLQRLDKSWVNTSRKNCRVFFLTNSWGLMDCGRRISDNPVLFHLVASF